MAIEEESNIEGTDLNPLPPPPNFLKGRKPSSRTNIGLEESTSVSEVAPSQAPILDALDSSIMARGSIQGSI